MRRRKIAASATKWKNVTKAEYTAAPQDERAIRDIGAERYYYVRVHGT